MSNSLGDRFKIRRKELRITQPQLAELAKVSVQTIYKLERGKGNPTLDILRKISEVLGMELTLITKSISNQS